VAERHQCLESSCLYYWRMQKARDNFYNMTASMLIIQIRHSCNYDDITLNRECYRTNDVTNVLQKVKDRQVRRAIRESTKTQWRHVLNYIFRMLSKSVQSHVQQMTWCILMWSKNTKPACCCKFQIFAELPPTFLYYSRSIFNKSIFPHIFFFSQLEPSSLQLQVTLPPITLIAHTSCNRQPKVQS